MEIIELKPHRIFSLEQAQQIASIVFRFTKTSKSQVDALVQQHETLQTKDFEKAREVEIEINKIVESWQTKVEKLGAYPRGLWLADFDCGDGYYCWKFPESELVHWHGYDEGFSNRVKIENQQQDTTPLF